MTIIVHLGMMHLNENSIRHSWHRCPRPTQVQLQQIWIKLSWNPIQNHQLYWHWLQQSYQIWPWSIKRKVNDYSIHRYGWNTTHYNWLWAISIKKTLSLKTLWINWVLLLLHLCILTTSIRWNMDKNLESPDNALFPTLSILLRMK